MNNIVTMEVSRLSLGLYKLSLTNVELPKNFTLYTYKVGDNYTWIDDIAHIENIIYEALRKNVIVKDMAMELLGGLNELSKLIVTITNEGNRVTLTSYYSLTDWLEGWSEILEQRGRVPQAIFTKHNPYSSGNKHLYTFEGLSKKEYEELLVRLRLEGVEYRTPLPVKLSLS